MVLSPEATVKGWVRPEQITVNYILSQRIEHFNWPIRHFEKRLAII